MTTIAKIRAEIERRLKEDYNSDDEEIDSVAQGVCAGILSFLDTLEEPVSEGLEEAANQYIGYPPEIDEGVITAARRIAFKAGAEWQKAKMMEGAVEGEVCGRVYDHINVRFADEMCKVIGLKNISPIPADVSKYKVGNKVKIIIVVKEDEK